MVTEMWGKNIRDCLAYITRHLNRKPKINNSVQYYRVCVRYHFSLRATGADRVASEWDVAQELDLDKFSRNDGNLRSNQRKCGEIYSDLRR